VQDAQRAGCICCHHTRRVLAHALALLRGDSGAHAEFGKQKLGVLLLSVKTSETLSGTHPLTKAPLAGSAPDVLAQALRRVRACDATHVCADAQRC
jgi:hypothetical protein